MHFLVRKAGNFKKFGGEYLMIVLSILTALALGDGAQALQHHSLASEASVKIDAEIRTNLDELNDVVAHNDKRAGQLDVIRKALLADIRSGMSDEVLMQKVAADYKAAFSLSIRSPTLRREAWEVAVANQSVSWMDSKNLKRYSSVYAAMREVQSISNGGANTFLDGPRMLDVASNVQMGVSNPREVYRMLNQAISSYNSANGNFKDLQTLLLGASGLTPAPETGKASKGAIAN